MTVSESIRTHHDAILAEWAEEAQRAAAARGLSRPELLNILPRYLAWLGERDGATPDAGRRLVEGHLSSRLREGFNVAEIQEEFSLLGRCIVERWSGEPPDRRPDPSDVASLFAELGAAGTVITEMFTQHLLDDEQTEKRYLREVQKIASEALEGDGLPLRARLCNVLDLVREALGADTAGLMLYEPASRKLVMAAAVGLAERELEQYSVSVDEASFAGRIASEDVEVINDVTTTELDVSPALRRNGIQSLLGVRLPAYRRLVGVMYVGLREKRSFTAGEVRRIEALGDRLTLHLDNAKLFAEVRQQVKNLEAERALREDFVAVLAHDLRGPLSAARVGADHLIRHPESLDLRREIAVRIGRGIDRVDDMIRDLLDASRVRAGEPMPLRLDSCDLVAVTRDAVEELSIVHGDRFVVEAAAPVVSGVWSAEELRRAIWNMAINAVKYGSPDTPITLSVRRTPTGAEIAIHNEGAPIADEDRGRLFETFGRGRARRPEHPRGWGLGLTLVKGVVDAHGGTVTVDSASGAGTTFTVRLPRDSREHQTAGTANGAGYLDAETART